jgi:dimethylargininase
MRLCTMEIQMMQRQPNSFQHAFVRPPGNSFVNALAVNPQPIDINLARKQHSEYVAALQEAGVQVEALEADERFPDSCFMQDPAMVIANVAILNRMGAASRLGETELVADILRARFETHSLLAPATLEGGDVLNVGDRLLVGETERTNRMGIEQLRAIAEPHGVGVESIPVREFLHLLTVVTYVGQGIVVVYQDFADHPSFQEFAKVVVPREEEYAANTLGIGNCVIMPAGYPKTEAQLRAQGFEVLPVPMSEFYKADGGVSCLSLLW